MKIVYDILLSLTISHDYFTSMLFEDFELVPNEKTNKILNEFRLFTKKNSNTWNLFFQKEGPCATTVDALADKEFWFALKINNSLFYSVTDDSYMNGKGELLYFNFSIDAEKIPERRKIRPLKFAYSINRDMRPVNIKLTTSKKVIFDDRIDDPQQKSRDVDLTNEGENAYDITEDNIPPRNLQLEQMFAKEGFKGDFFYGTVYFKILPVNEKAAANQYSIVIPKVVKSPDSEDDLNTITTTKTPDDFIEAKKPIK